MNGDLKTFINAGVTVGNGARLSAFGNYAQKETDGGFYYRNPDNRKAYTPGAPTGRWAPLTADGSGRCPAMLHPRGEYYLNGTFQADALHLLPPHHPPGGGSGFTGKYVNTVTHHGPSHHCNVSQ